MPVAVAVAEALGAKTHRMELLRTLKTAQTIRNILTCGVVRCNVMRDGVVLFQASVRSSQSSDLLYCFHAPCEEYAFGTHTLCTMCCTAMGNSCISLPIAMHR